MGHVNNVVYVRYVQETAEAHWKTIASNQLQQTVLWVVLRHEIDYKSAAFEGDLLNCTTWIEKNEGPKMPRFVTIKNESGKVLIEAKTMWCAVDTQKHRPIRISQEIYDLFKG
ncbi:acyl-CoA thioesterase [Fulvivirga sp. RKSG066]|nr:acyl-CoA thioesterase [Fulvivirga aurantia]